MKLIDADKLKAEIERLKSKYRHNGLWLSSTQSLLAGAKIEAMNELLPFLDSLQQEQQDVDLEKEIDNVIADYSFVKTIDSGGFKTTVLDYAKIARHFYELGKQAMKQQMLKDAVEGEIQMRYSGCLCAKTIRTINEDKFKLGEKVRIIIVKEEEK